MGARVKLNVVGFDLRESTRKSSPNYADGQICAGVDANCWTRPAALEQLHEKSLLWTGCNATLWDELAAVRRYAKDKGLANVSVLCIALVQDDDNPAIAHLPDAGGGLLHLDYASPAQVAPAWPHLGYDVADAFFESVLCTYWHALADVADAGDKTESGCFAQLAEAYRARRIAEERIPEHAPFFVFSVFLVEEGVG